MILLNVNIIEASSDSKLTLNNPNMNLALFYNSSCIVLLHTLAKKH